MAWTPRRAVLALALAQDTVGPSVRVGHEPRVLVLGPLAAHAPRRVQHDAREALQIFAIGAKRHNGPRQPCRTRPVVELAANALVQPSVGSWHDRVEPV